MCCGESPSQESKENQSLEEENHSFKMNVETKRTKEWEGHDQVGDPHPRAGV